MGILSCCTYLVPFVFGACELVVGAGAVPFVFGAACDELDLVVEDDFPCVSPTLLVVDCVPAVEPVDWLVVVEDVLEELENGDSIHLERSKSLTGVDCATGSTAPRAGVSPNTTYGSVVFVLLKPTVEYVSFTLLIAVRLTHSLSDTCVQ